jgi:hypothetical protein
MATGQSSLAVISRPDSVGMVGVQEGMTPAGRWAAWVGTNPRPHLLTSSRPGLSGQGHRSDIFDARRVLALWLPRRRGDAYHHDPEGVWLHKGQRRAHRQGKNVRAIEHLAWSSVSRVSWNRVNPAVLRNGSNVTGITTDDLSALLSTGRPAKCASWASSGPLPRGDGNEADRPHYAPIDRRAQDGPTRPRVNRLRTDQDR